MGRDNKWLVGQANTSNFFSEAVVKFRPRGNSMSGKVENGDLVTVAPVGNHVLKIGDIVLCKVNGVHYLHLVKAVSGDRVQIGNNKGRINGWTSRRNIFGVVTEISS